MLVCLADERATCLGTQLLNTGRAVSVPGPLQHQVTAEQVRVAQRGHSILRLTARHKLDKRKAARPPVHLLGHTHAFEDAMRTKELANVFLCRLEGHVFDQHLG